MPLASPAELMLLGTGRKRAGSLRAGAGNDETESNVPDGQEQLLQSAARERGEAARSLTG